MILILGSMARNASSKRTWSFPLPYGALLAIEPSLCVVSIRPPCCLALPAEFHRPAVPVCGTLPSRRRGRHCLDGLLELLAQYVRRAGEGGPCGADRPLLSEGVPPRGHREVFKESTRLSSRLHALVRQDQIPFLYEGFEEAVGGGEQTCTLRRRNKASFKDPCDLFDWLSKWHVAGLAVKMVLLQSPHIGLEVVVPTVHP